MSFLNATLLAGMLAAAVPVVLHFLARQQPKRVVFPGVAFLASRLTAQKSRLRIRRWWLLALRVLAVIALALVLARPHIDASMSSSWWTIGLVGVVAIGLIALASIAFSRNLTRGLSWSLLAAAVVAMIAAGIGAVTTLANSTTPELTTEQPISLAIVIDNSPSSSWQITAPQKPASGPENAEVFNGGSTRLATAAKQARELIKRLPSGSRLSMIDRSDSPVGFSLDVASAGSRLDQFEPLAMPAPIADRIEAAIELVRTSDLPNRQVIVITDLAEPTWNVNVPSSDEASRLGSEARKDVRLSVLKIATGEDSSENAANVAFGRSFNRALSIPEIAEVSPSAGAPILVSVNVSTTTASSATVQLQLYQNDPTLPVVRDGKTALPPLRTVDRASVAINPGTDNEVLMSLPPLPLGTYHAVIELVGDDSFSWDNRRYLTIRLPRPPKVLVIGDDRDEVNVIAAAITAPYEIDDPSAPYEIQTVAYRGLSAIDWQPFELMIMVNPPVQYDVSQSKWTGSSAGLSRSMIDQLTDMVRGGAGLMISLGPATKIVRGTGSEDAAAVNAQDSPSVESENLLPRLVRTWRVPDPGTFLRIIDPSHPIVAALTRPSAVPNWSDFRVRRYWQTEPAGWNTIASFAQRQREEKASEGDADAAAILTRSFGRGRIAVTTTPIPALGPISRTWNDLFTGGDAWPAFVTVRGIASWLAGLRQNTTTVLVGQTVVLDYVEPSPSESSPDDAKRQTGPNVSFTSTFQIYPPDRLPYAVSPRSSGDGVDGESILPINGLSTPGTYFLRSFGDAGTPDAPENMPSQRTDSNGGVSVNLPIDWSTDRVVDQSVLRRWFGGSDDPAGDDTTAWSLDRDAGKISLGGGGDSTAVSLHGPLMLLAVLVFVVEQLLSNYFYSANSSRPVGVPATGEAA